MTAATIELTIVMVLVRCRWCSAPIGMLPQGTRYEELRCPATRNKCRLTTSGVA